MLKELGHYDEAFGATPQDADGDLSSYSFHMADQGTDAMEREKAFLFASQEGRFLWHIDEALRRLYRSPETFGKCHNCGQRHRLRAARRAAARALLHRVQAARGRCKVEVTRALFWPVLVVVIVVVDVITKAIAERALAAAAHSARGARRHGAAHARLQSGRGVRAAPRAVLALDLHGAHGRARSCILGRLYRATRAGDTLRDAGARARVRRARSAT